jgi:hypothetical protein
MEKIAALTSFDSVVRVLFGGRKPDETTITESTLAVSSDLQELLTVVCHMRASMKRGVILVAHEES